MRRNVLAYIILVAILLVMPSITAAKLVAVNDEALDGISGQAGVQIAFNNANLKIDADTIYYGDDDGIDGSGPAYLSLCGVSMDAQIHSNSPMRVDIGVIDDPFNNGKRIEAVMMKISDLTLDITNFKIDAIRVGSQIGEGKSFGSFGIQHMHTEITGNIMIWAH